ncbi:hypothetical protein ACFL22_00325 [Patescibacteria group bacterium]
MEQIKNNEKLSKFISTIAILAVVAGISFVGGMNMDASNHSMHDMNHEHMSMSTDDGDKHRMAFIAEKDAIIEHLIMDGKYKCCLEKPCSYCIEKSPGHGEGATCNCLEDIVNGVHPCGECIGEILEGHGNAYLSEYFALAIAEKVGMEHIDTFRQIIFEKYGTAIEKQS